MKWNITIIFEICVLICSQNKTNYKIKEIFSASNKNEYKTQNAYIFLSDCTNLAHKN